MTDIGLSYAIFLPTNIVFSRSTLKKYTLGSGCQIEQQKKGAAWWYNECGFSVLYQKYLRGFVMSSKQRANYLEH